ncbi:hypothetical protein SKAU_G00197510 [Synaphobranchus kaupii]|uniref:Uncharacterized protein n=1 Tax=Synaphobranchus kaupii TaxID=118154 RepID=A0A9Q1FF15_SYNKA|nr:hypothetical protein SKAU_G00197510 [Synaphobranchus kaupii]
MGKCGGVNRKQPCIAQAGEASGIQGRVENHSAIRPNVAEARQEERREKRIKWPKFNEAGEWRRLDEHLSELLQKTLRGPVEAKLNLFSEILYEECSGRYGEVTSRKTAARIKGRREKEIEDLVASRRQLRKRWRKAEEREKEGLKALWDDIRERLANLRRSECIRQRRRKRKEKERANFFRNPFRFARGLLEEKTERWRYPKKIWRNTFVFSTATLQGLTRWAPQAMYPSP